MDETDRPQVVGYRLDRRSAAERASAVDAFALATAAASAFALAGIDVAVNGIPFAGGTGTDVFAYVPVLALLFSSVALALGSGWVFRAYVVSRVRRGRRASLRRLRTAAMVGAAYGVVVAALAFAAGCRALDMRWGRANELWLGGMVLAIMLARVPVAAYLAIEQRRKRPRERD